MDTGTDTGTDSDTLRQTQALRRTHTETDTPAQTKALTTALKVIRILIDTETENAMTHTHIPGRNDFYTDNGDNTFVFSR